MAKVNKTPSSEALLTAKTPQKHPSESEEVVTILPENKEYVETLAAVNEQAVEDKDKGLAALASLGEITQAPVKRKPTVTRYPNGITETTY